MSVWLMTTGLPYVARPSYALADPMASRGLAPEVQSWHSQSRASEAIEAVGAGRVNGTVVVTV